MRSVVTVGLVWSRVKSKSLSRAVEYCKKKFHQLWEHQISVLPSVQRPHSDRYLHAGHSPSYTMPLYNPIFILFEDMLKITGFTCENSSKSPFTFLQLPAAQLQKRAKPTHILGVTRSSRHWSKYDGTKVSFSPNKQKCGKWMANGDPCQSLSKNQDLFD